MEHYDIERRAILDNVAVAFKDVRLGNGISLHQARNIDDNWNDDPELKKNDPEVSWAELTDAKLREFHDVFVFLDAEGFRFYLPAYIGWILRDAADGLDDPFEFALCGWQNADGSWETPSKIVERLAMLTQPQMRALCRFIHYQERPESRWAAAAIVACAKFWDQQCGP